MVSKAKPRKRNRGELEELSSGSIRVRVYAGVDPVTKKRYHLTEVVPAGPQAYKEAEKVRTRLLNQVDEKRNPRTKATVGELLARHLEELHIEETTWTGYETLVRNHVRPLIGHMPLAKVDGEVLDSFYRQLRTCRRHCQGAALVDHRTAQTHECDDRCKPHTCRPLAANSLRNIRSVLSGAGKRAK